MSGFVQGDTASRTEAYTTAAGAAGFVGKLGHSRVMQANNARSLPRSCRRGGRRLKAMLS